MNRSDDLLPYVKLKKTLKARIGTGVLKCGDRILSERLVVSVGDNLLERDPDPGELDRMASLVREARPFSCFYALNNRLLAASMLALQAAGILVENIRALDRAVVQVVLRSSPPARRMVLHGTVRYCPPIYPRGRNGGISVWQIWRGPQTRSCRSSPVGSSRRATSQTSWPSRHSASWSRPAALKS